MYHLITIAVITIVKFSVHKLCNRMEYKYYSKCCLFSLATSIQKHFRRRRMQLNSARLTPRFTSTKAKITGKEKAFYSNYVGK